LASEGAGPQEVSVEEFSADLEQWVEAVNDFIGDVRFDDADMRSFLDHYGEFAAMMDDERGEGGEEDYSEENWDEMEEPSMSESFQELLTLMEDGQYRAWATANGLDAEDWMQKSARILILSQGTAMAEFFEMSEAQMQEQVAGLEAQREQMGEEMYAAMMDSFKMMQLTGEAWGDLPEATAAEAKIIADHMDEISQLLQLDEGDEWGT
jgi:hypothetical protein